ncbi:MAG: LysR family transcriptional regulator [Flavobacteriales bacterium]|nr:LysR family transcriptional regulator [Flavobacteriales bacterium]
MITLQQMQYISVLAEELHFLKASERCFVSQPTLSMQVKKAEETLGGIIFDRSSIPLKLTSFGKQMLPVVRDVLEENEKLTELMGRIKGNLIEEIKIGIIPTVAVYMIPSIFLLLKDSLTQAKITFEEMKSEELIVALENHKIDLGIMAGPYVDVKIESIQLFREQILVYCRELTGDNLRLEQY